MILHEQILDLRQWKITILASDLSMTALETAQRGVYPIEKLDGIEERLIARYFKKTPEGYGIIDEIKRHIVFDFHNLMHEGGYKDFDAVFCRNVLIYFDDETQKKGHRQVSEGSCFPGIPCPRARRDPSGKKRQFCFHTQE